LRENAARNEPGRRPHEDPTSCADSAASAWIAIGRPAPAVHEQASNLLCCHKDEMARSAALALSRHPSSRISATALRSVTGRPACIGLEVTARPDAAAVGAAAAAPLGGCERRARHQRESAKETGSRSARTTLKEGVSHGKGVIQWPTPVVPTAGSASSACRRLTPCRVPDAVIRW
jgi:hypothetical protein